MSEHADRIRNIVKELSISNNEAEGILKIEMLKEKIDGLEYGDLKDIFEGLLELIEGAQ